MSYFETFRSVIRAQEMLEELRNGFKDSKVVLRAQEMCFTIFFFKLKRQSPAT